MNYDELLLIIRTLCLPLIKAAQNYVTLAEMTGELKEVFGTYQETAVF
jgi:hypothetical protein